MKKTGYLLAGLLVVSACMQVVQAGWRDYLDTLKGSVTDEGASQTISGTALSNEDMIQGLKEALEKGTRFAVDNLGQENGFLNNARVRIPMPESLSWVEKTLRTLRQDRLADEFVTSMNRAAEQAVPEAAAIFTDAIREMTLEDARGILTGPDDAATQYFKSRTGDTLATRMRPIVSQATQSSGVTSSYKDMMSSAGGLTNLLSSDVTDLDGYVTQKALDGLFLMVAEEEKRIRENPVARSSDLLKKVFGSLSQ